MPVYEYVCEKCAHQQEALRPMRDADAALSCEKCGSAKMKRVQSVFAATSGGGRETSLPMGGCGRCGDPRGSCGV